MLQYFPTPYPDELWYSVLCRYHVRSGNLSYLTTIKELFPGKTDAVIGSFFPNSILYDVIKQLPEGFLDIETVALEHTLFKYAFRFQSTEKKRDMINLIKEGQSAFPMKLCEADQKYPKLKACPVCMKEDRERYGETYWHLCHQIPLVNICQKHKCALWVYECSSKSELNRKFLLPDTCDNLRKDYKTSPYDIPFTETLTKYQYLPLEVGPTEGYNNIYEALINKGYGTVRRGMDFLMNLKQISKDLCALYGEEFMHKNFLAKDINRLISNQMRLWNLKSPERYAILAVLAGLTVEETFSPEKIENRIYCEFRKMSKEPVPQYREYIAKKLGVKPDHINIIAENLGIPPFWRESRDSKSDKKERIVISLTLEEKQRIKAYVKANGFTDGSSFILHCIEQTMENGNQMI